MISSPDVRYGEIEIEIECGGQISGDVQAQPSAEHGECARREPTPYSAASRGGLRLGRRNLAEGLLKRLRLTAGRAPG